MSVPSSRLSLSVFPLDRPQWIQELPVEAALATELEEPPSLLVGACTLCPGHTPWPSGDTAHSGSHPCAKSDLANGELGEQVHETEAGGVVFTFPQQT